MLEAVISNETDIENSIINKIEFNSIQEFCKKYYTNNFE